jgi:anti-sigma B factor antagonist
MSSQQNPSSGLEIGIRQEAESVVVTAKGEVTVFSSPALRDSLRKIAESKPPRVILDLAETRYVDSSGVATLVEAMQTLQRYRGKLILAGMNPRVRGVFEIARLDSIFTTAASVEEALKA